VQVRPSTGSDATRIGYDGWAVRILSCDDPQQLTPGGPLPTGDAHAHRTHVTTGQSFHHTQV
jgi:hypothetical protein